MKKILESCIRAGRRLFQFLRERRGGVIYGAAMLAVLIAIACAADGYRDRHPAQTPTSPSAALAALQARPEVAERPQIPADWTCLRIYSALPEWNAALGQWETHAGADCAPDGGRVSCVCAGVVSDIGRSGRLGGYVRVTSGEYTLTYASVTPAEGLKIGDAVEAGDTIAAADESMAGEAWLGAHAHLELERAGEALDPRAGEGEAP